MWTIAFLTISSNAFWIALVICPFSPVTKTPSNIVRLSAVTSREETPTFLLDSEAPQVLQRWTRNSAASLQSGGNVLDSFTTEGRRGRKYSSLTDAGISLLSTMSRLNMSLAIPIASGRGYCSITWAANWIPNCWRKKKTSVSLYSTCTGHMHAYSSSHPPQDINFANILWFRCGIAIVHNAVLSYFNLVFFLGIKHSITSITFMGNSIFKSYWDMNYYPET